MAPPGDACLDHDSLTLEVEGWLGTREVDIPIEIEVRGEGGTATLVIRRDGEAQVIKTFDVLPVVCRARRKAVSLAIALAIDHTVLARSNVDDAPAAPVNERTAREATAQAPTMPAPMGAPVVDPAVSSVPLPAVSAAPSAPEPAVATRRLSGLLGGAIVTGVLPASAWVGSGGCGVRLTRRMSIRVLGLVTQEVELPLASGTLATRLAAVRVDGCREHPMGGVVGSACAGIAGGSVTAIGRDFDDVRTTHRPWAGTQLRVAARFPATTAVSIELAIEGMVTVVRPRVHLEDDEGNEVAARSFPFIGGGASLELVVNLL